MRTKTHNLAEFQKTAQEFALGLAPLPDRATVVGLYGDLGAGKTTFVQAVAKAFGVVEVVNSPTFLIFKKYQLSHGLSTSLEVRSEDLELRKTLSVLSSKSEKCTASVKKEIERGCSFSTLVHVDAYRLKNSDELRNLRFSELLTDPKNLILVEWADKVADLLPKDHTQLHFEFVDDTTRTISFS
ncbi:MAG: hypothetical protein UY50_C0014G0011 [Parcubacteria group bacterium GW2011_GWA2_49_9]|nr:MAG: hypothetical protein UY50_C0014G0011 [Parcubacteria group bacterium GW2011_GWA2_49_9]